MSDDCLPDCMMPDGGQCCRGYAKQRDRIEALEKHKRLQMEDIMNLGAQLGQAWQRIEQLEASLAEWRALAIQWAKDNEDGL